jgi:hypothetical protein
MKCDTCHRFNVRVPQDRGLYDYCVDCRSERQQRETAARDAYVPWYELPESHPGRNYGRGR